MKKWQLPLTIASLLAALLGMNYVVDWQQQQAKAEAKQVKEEREAAEMKAMAAKGEAADPSGHADHGGVSEAFALPKNTGPAQAPVKLEVFVNNSKSCQGINPGLKEMQDVYASLLRVEWCSMTDPKAAERSDKLKIGCEAGLAINGKIEVEVERNGGKTLVDFRGPAGDKFKLSDVYLAINQALQSKGKQPPQAAVVKAAPSQS